MGKRCAQRETMKPILRTVNCVSSMSGNISRLLTITPRAVLNSGIQNAALWFSTSRSSEFQGIPWRSSWGPQFDSWLVNEQYFAWKIPWTEEPGRLQFMGSLESDTTERAEGSPDSRRAQGRLRGAHPSTEATGPAATRVSWSPLSGLKGVQPPLPFGERTRDCANQAAYRR